LNLSIVIPTYNESDRILNTLDALAEYLQGHLNDCEIIVSDDGSSDNTCEQVLKWINKAKRLFDINASLIQSIHKGKGSAIRNGMLRATGDYRIMFDADLAMRPYYIHDFISSMEKGYDVVIGSREIRGANRFQEPYARHLMGRIFNYYVRLLLVQGYQDTQCGYKCFTGVAANHLFSNQKINGWSFDVEVLFLANKYRMDVLEIPIDWYHINQSKVKLLKTSIEMICDTFLIKIRNMCGVYPNSIE